MKSLVYGSGNYFEAKKKYIDGTIIGFIDSYQAGEKDNLPVYLPEQIANIEYDLIYVMAKENFFCEMVYTLLQYNVPADKIVIGQNLPSIWGEQLFVGQNKLFYIDENNKLNYKIDDIEIAFSTYDEFYGIRDVFCNRDYDFGIANETAVICDIGMNIGAASLYFARRNNVEKIYSYEPFPLTYESALYNISKNSKYSKKIEPNNWGISDKKQVQEFLYNPSMTCGLSTSKELVDAAKDFYISGGMYNKKFEQTVKIELVDVAEVLPEIIEKHPRQKLIIKLDCEGLEYEIIQRLYDVNLLKDVDMIMMEWHYKGEMPIRNLLEKSGFFLFSFAKGIYMGNIYAIRK